MQTSPPLQAKIPYPPRGAARLLALASFGAAIGLAAPGTAPAQHVISFVNRCQEQVWLAEFGSSSIDPHDWALAPRCTKKTKSICPSGECKKKACTCTSDADCTFGAPAGTETATCDTMNGVCVSKVTIEVPAGWSGRFWPRTGCSGPSTSFVCETGQCGPESGGNIDCTVQGATANLATLFEVATAANGGTDNFDVSLVSGFNIPIRVNVVRPADSPQWEASTAYASGAQILEPVGKDVFNFTNGGSAGTSGATQPAFPATWTGTVADGSDIVWVNTGPACLTSGCKRRGLLEQHCPSVLRVTSDDGYVACDVPANVCADEAQSCNADLSYFQCQNVDGETDLFGKLIGLQSPNAATFVCFSARDCPAGTTCELDPTFEERSFSLPSGAGLCTPVAQNGGCTPGDDGDACPAINYPFVGYVCQTLSDQVDNAQVCVPPVTSGVGDLWWNAANWTEVSPAQSCTDNSGCGGSDKCLVAPVHEGLKQCTAQDASCTCWTPQTCTAATCPGANQCLNSNGVPDGKQDGQSVVDCATETCYCGPQGIYSGACGPTNPAWQQAAESISEAGASWPHAFKNRCPIAYSYQFDDPSSNWSCPNPAQGLNKYRVVFCGGVPPG